MICKTLGVDEMGRPVVIRWYIVEGKEVRVQDIRNQIPAYVSTQLLEARLKRGVNTLAKLRQHPKDVIQSNGAKNGKRNSKDSKSPFQRATRVGIDHDSPLTKLRKTGKLESENARKKRLLGNDRRFYFEQNKQE